MVKSLGLYSGLGMGLEGLVGEAHGTLQVLGSGFRGSGWLSPWELPGFLDLDANQMIWIKVTSLSRHINITSRSSEDLPALAMGFRVPMKRIPQYDRFPRNFITKPSRRWVSSRVVETGLSSDWSDMAG